MDGITLVKNFAKTQSSNNYYNHVAAILSTPTIPHEIDIDGNHVDDEDADHNNENIN
jgi:N-acetylglucosamine-6-phosphate deacetylase